MHDWLVRVRTREEVEREHQAAEEAALDAETPPTGQDLVDELNRIRLKARRRQGRLVDWGLFVLTALAWALVLALLIWLMTGCVRVAREPELPFPPSPAFHFYRMPSDPLCMSEEDAQALRLWLRKLDVFEQARQRALSEQKTAAPQ